MLVARLLVEQVTTKRKKPKFHVGEMVWLVDSKQWVELVARHQKLPGVWEWRIKGWAIGTAPEHLIRKTRKEADRG